MNELLLEVLPVATKIGIHHRLFVGIISSTKNFKKLPLLESFFNITQEKEITQKGNNVLKFCKLHNIFAKLSLFF